MNGSSPCRKRHLAYPCPVSISPFYFFVARERRTPFVLGLLQKNDSSAYRRSKGIQLG